MKGNPTAGILLLLGGALLIGLGGKYQQNIKSAWLSLTGKGATATPTTIPKVIENGTISKTAGDTMPKQTTPSVPSLTGKGTMVG